MCTRVSRRPVGPARSGNGQYWALAVTLVAVGAVALAVTGDTFLRVIGVVARGDGVVTFGVVGLATDRDGDEGIDRLLEGVRRLDRGEYDLDLPTDRDDRIGRLASELDDLAGSLAAAEGMGSGDARNGNARAATGSDGTRAALRDERRFEAVFEDPGMLVGILEPDGTHLLSNETAMSYVDADRDEIEGVPFWETPWWEGHEATQRMIREKVERAAAGEYVSYEADLEDASGDRFSREGTIRPVTEDGEVVSLVVSSRDITERKERERDLERYRTLVNAIRDSACIYDADGRIEVANRALANFYQTTPADLIGAKSHLVEQLRAESDEDPFQALVDGRRDELRGEYATTYPEAGYAVVEYRMTRLTVDGEFDGVAAVARDVTERKERERQRRAIVENTINPIYIKDPEGRYQFVNEAGAEFFGRERADVVGKTDRELFDEASAAAAADDREILETGESIVAERTWQVGGEDVVFLDNKYPYRDEDGEIVGVIGISKDITDLKNRERELRERERELSTLMDNLPGMVYRCANEPGWPFEFVSEGSLAVTGYDPAALESGAVNWGKEVIAGDSDEIWTRVQTAVDNREPFQLTYRAEDADGETRWLWERGRGVYDADGDLEALEGVVMDVTEREERERELERTKYLLALAGEMGTIGGWSVDVSGERPYRATWTDELYDIFGVDPDEPPLVEGVFDRYHPDDREQHRAAVDRAIEDGERWDQELRLDTDDDAERWVHSIGEVVVEDGETVEIRGSVQDVTERKERERDLERTAALLDQAQRVAAVGGWEIELEAGEPTGMTWTDQFYDIFEFSRDRPPTVEQVVEHCHPEDRDGVERAMGNAIAEGTGFDMEMRIRTVGGRERWVRSIGHPVREDGETVALRGSIQDITDQKRRELALHSLHDTALRLLGTDTEAEVTDLVIDVAAEVVDTAAVGLYLLDDETNTLEPVATTDAFADRFDGPPSVSVGDAESLVWNTYVTETRTVVEDGDVADDTGLFDSDTRNGVLVPIGDHGVFVALSSGGPIDATTRQLIETLVATTEAALDRLRSEAALRERDAELAAQNERLRRQVQITDIIRSIDRSLIGATTREEIERAVCERLVADEPIGFAWIGTLDPDGESVTPRRWAGDGERYLDAVSADRSATTPEPAWQAARTESPVIVENVVDDLQREAWRKPALANDFHSAMAVPLAFDEYSYGVLAVYATEPDAFGDLERTVFTELGESIANSITAARTRQALHAETLLELELSFTDADDLLARIARDADCRVDYEGLATGAEDEDRIFFVADGTEPDAVRAILDGLVSVTDSRLISDADGLLFEVTTTASPVAAKLVSHGGRPQSLTADAAGMDVVVDLPTSTDVRELVEMLGDDHPSVELTARRHVERTTHTRRELVATLFEALTDRQREVLETAYLAGFFEQPRETTGEELAAMLGVSQPTVNRHLRLAQQRLMEQLFAGGEEESAAP